MAPEPGWTTKARVVYVLDGDTVEVEVVRKLRIRILDCWAPETRTTDLDEKEKGIVSKEHLQKLLPAGSPVTVAIPSSVDGEIQDVLTMGRFLAHIWNTDGINVAEEQVKSGHATKEK